MLRVASSDEVFTLTGAGVSAESGVPTFRGAGGLWRNYRIEEIASPRAWQRAPRLVWEFYSMRRRVAAAAKPNPAHFALARLEQSLGDRLFLCTQNVDNLHEQAGSQRVVHMHGELFKSRCDRCSRSPFGDTRTYDPPAEIPTCPCGGRIRPRARTVYVGPEEPANRSSFTDCYVGRAGELLPSLFEVEGLSAKSDRASDPSRL
ncbi:MAG: NAD-dependent deacylase [Acidobacteriia bacterium]|nr:NAD-dependent deacylase [Terriglobia bacterium]